MKRNNEALKRNAFKTQFFDGVVLEGQFEFPKVYAQSIDFACEFLPFNIYRGVKNKSDVGVHFFVDDYHFECLWLNVERYVDMLRQAKVVIGPDFSIYADMPIAMQIYNAYRNRALTAFLQSRGVKVVPVISWSDESSFEWCFDSIEKGSAVAISSNGATKSKSALQAFLKGYHKMKEEITPSQILFVGRIPKELEKEQLIKIKSFSQILKERLGG